MARVDTIHVHDQPMRVYVDVPAEARARSADRIRRACGSGGLRDIDLEARCDLRKRAVEVRDVLVELGLAGRWFARPRGDG